MSDLGLHHIPETLQRGNFFRERPEGNRKNYRKLQTIQLPQGSCILDFHLSNKAQPARNLWWLPNTWMGITKHSTKCFNAWFSWKNTVWFQRGEHQDETAASSQVPASPQPEAPTFPLLAPQGIPEALCVCSWTLFVVESVPTVQFYLGKNNKTQFPTRHLWQLEDREIKPQRENSQT